VGLSRWPCPPSRRSRRSGNPLTFIPERGDGRGVRAYFAQGLHRRGHLRSALLLVCFTSVVIALLLLQILLWTAFYRWNCFPSWEFAFYFSPASYSTVGSGDVLLPQIWRTLGPVESITGVLMCGLSVSILFTIVLRLVEREVRFSPEPAWPTRQQSSPPLQSSLSLETKRTR
jgi:hypothetical protein